MFADYRRRNFLVWSQRQKERRARQLAARIATQPLTPDEGRVIEQIDGWLASGSSLWIAVLMVFKSESDFCKFVRSALADPRESLRSEIRRLMQTPWLYESGSNGDRMPARFYDWRTVSDHRFTNWRDL